MLLLMLPLPLPLPSPPFLLCHLAIFMIQISGFFTWPRILQHMKIKKEFDKLSRCILFLFTMINKFKLYISDSVHYSEDFFDCRAHYCNYSLINFGVPCHQWVNSILDSTILLWLEIPLWYIFFVYKKPHKVLQEH